ncbi:hypothetical protein [Myroides odoratimimus]|uniref:hypothetical protein n=1 Tax=Myroides odoratimimus TaxID=76832 RepID=UPI0029C09C15|nr:hypothetical protein [Myroides odoratimimus]MDX4973702.1 hypothetical protein [Myroides odoratimimus]
MTHELSIEDLKERIHNKQTQEYFDEILRSYYSGLYRATIVMLYTVTISDLFLKLLELENDFGDERAKKIIETIKDEQTRDPKSTSWENSIIEDTQKKIKLITIDVLADINFLKQKRHLCAHPAITQENILYSPNRETTLSLIILMLKGVFTVSPLDRIDTFSIILTDIEEKNKKLPLTQIREYIKTKYLSKISNNNKKEILKKFWSITFNCSSKACEDNRILNLVFIDALIFNHLYDIKDFFSEYKTIVEKVKPEYYPMLFLLLNKSLDIYPLLDKSFKDILSHALTENYNLQIRSIFTIKELNETTVKQFLEDNLYSVRFRKKSDSYTTEYAELLAINDIIGSLNFHKFTHLTNEILIRFFGCSRDYDTADYLFENAIRPNLEKFNKEDLLLLAHLINSNSQIYGRNKATSSNQLIINRMDTMNIPKEKYEDLIMFNV